MLRDISHMLAFPGGYTKYHKNILRNKRDSIVFFIQVAKVCHPGIILIHETERRQYEGHNTPLCYYTDQGP